ncbi:Hyaluronan synthase [Terricaulis silvestris]|uniref:Hyaluronan synthase n=2 Tax=Terricaulis silvestris TaxID=2686094 RepID=A0A6I6MMU4_9CAUL|nr:Hyaluronan synthase [Terricaulis silvestris]
MMGDSSSPLVVIATPVYNGAKFIEAAVRSVRAQTYRPLVHCVLNNASTDGTGEILARLTAEPGVQLIVRHNSETLPQADNFNAVLGLIPSDAKYFRLLCADDSIPPDAISAMVRVAESADNVVMTAGIERVNGSERPHYFPTETEIFEASNAVARILSDEARIPHVHVLYRTDVLRAGEEFYATAYNATDIDAVLRVLSRGGRMGFVHAPIADTTHHPDSRTQTYDKQHRTYIWEKFVFIERYGPAALSNTEFARLRMRYRRIVYRRLLWWAATGGLQHARRDLERLRVRGSLPSLLDYLDAVVAWPAHLYTKAVSRLHEPRPWPSDAARPVS